MLFIFDENFSKNLAQGLNLLEKSNPAREILAEVISAEELMGKRGATDEEIIIAAGRRKGVIITKDKDFKQIKLLEKIIEASGTKVLFFKFSKKRIKFWDILTAIVGEWEVLKEKLSKEPPPYVYQFDNKGISPFHF